MSREGRGERNTDRLSWLQEITKPTPMAPVRGTGNGMSEGLGQGSLRGYLEVSLDLDEIEGGSRAEVGGMNSGPQRTGPLMTHLAHTFGGYPLHLSTCRTICQMSLRYLEWNRLLLGMPWKVPIPPHYHGRSRSKRESNSRKVQPKGVGLGLRAILSLMCPPSV